MFRNAGFPVGMAMLAFVALLGLNVAVLSLSEAPSSSAGPPPNHAPEANASIVLGERLAQAAEDWPEFGGYYLKRLNRNPPYDYTVYVYVKDACQQEVAEGAARHILGAERFGQDIFGVNAVQADFTIAQLSEWYRHVGRISDPGLILAELGEGRNRLEIGVTDEAAAQRIEEKLEELPVPREAVAVRIREPVRVYESGWDLPEASEIQEELSDALLEDLETIARQKGISLDEAIRRYGSQGSVLSLLDTIRETFPDDYAWARVAVLRRGWVGFAGSPPAAALWMIERSVESQRGSTVEVLSHLGFNEFEKDDAISAFHYAVYDAPEAGVGLSGMDPETGHLRTSLWMHGDVCDAAVLDDVKASATKALIDATRADILNSIKIDVILTPIPPSLRSRMDGPVLTSPFPEGGFGGVDHPLGGTVVFDEGIECLYLARAGHRSAVVWPAGASWQSDPPAVKLQGQLIEPGMSVEGEGTSTSYAGVRNAAGVAVADAARACAEHVAPSDQDIGIALFNMGTDVDLVP